MSRQFWPGVAAVVIAATTFVSMNYLRLADEVEVVLVGLHLSANAYGAGLGCVLVCRRRWLGLVVLIPSLAFLVLQLSWFFQCCR